MTSVVEISTFWTLSLILGGLLLVGLMRALRHLIEQQGWQNKPPSGKHGG